MRHKMVGTPSPPYLVDFRHRLPFSLVFDASHKETVGNQGTSSRFQQFSQPCTHFRPSMANREGKIPESAFKVNYISCRVVTDGADESQIGVGILYGIAILAASMRIALRIHSQRRLFLDDAFLLFACAALTAATPVLYRDIVPLYFVQELASEGLSPEKFSQSSGVNGEAEVQLYQVLHFTYEALVWTAIFSVKFSFLAFFRQIIDRIQSLVLYWKIVGVMNILACAFCVCFSFMECPQTEYEASKWSQSSCNLKVWI